MAKKTTTTKPASAAEKIKPAAKSASKPAPKTATARPAVAAKKPSAAPKPAVKPVAVVPVPATVAAKKPAPKKKAAPAAKAAKPVITSDDIALRAYYLAEKRAQLGLPGDSHGDWLEAERQLTLESKSKVKA